MFNKRPIMQSVKCCFALQAHADPYGVGRIPLQAYDIRVFKNRTI